MVPRFPRPPLNRMRSAGLNGIFRRHLKLCLWMCVACAYVVGLMTTLITSPRIYTRNLAHKHQNNSGRLLTVSDLEGQSGGRLDVPSLTGEKQWKKILIWTDYFKYTDIWRKIFRRVRLSECEESRCLLSQRKADAAEADAVLFNAYNLQDRTKAVPMIKKHIYDVPATRSRDQVYIFYSMEPPSRLVNSSYLKTFANFFNWTMTYRRDSDVVEPFGVVRRRGRKKPKRQIKRVTQVELDAKRKSKKMAVWIASHCPSSPLKRQVFVAELQQYIGVDVLGGCGKTRDDVAANKIFGTRIGTSASEKDMTNYLFYLALENSLCDDYVTEKIYKAFKLGVVPVVWGAADYASFAPPNSLIDHRDFNSTAALADYLKKVASDPKLYNKYFEWQEDYEVEVGSPYDPFVCDLCKKLHAQTPAQFYPDIEDWFVAKSHCRSNQAPTTTLVKTFVRSSPASRRRRRKQL